MAATQYDDLIPLGRSLPLRVYLRSLWERRQFAISVPLGELRAQHMNTVLGNVWHLLNPALMVGVYFLIFGVILNVNRGVENLIGFLAVGVFSYRFIQRSISQCSQAISSNEGLIRSLSFPRAILPISAVVREGIAFLSSIVLMVVVVLARGEPVTTSWLYVLALVPLMTLFALGVGFILARLTDRVRDVHNLLPFAFRLTFYASGIIFPIDIRIAEKAANNPSVDTILAWLPLNPLFTYPALMRQSLMASYQVDDRVLPFLWPAAIIYPLVLIIVGFAFFRRAEQRYGRG